MTPLKPIQNLRVTGVASETYPVNEKCAHPECSEDATVHHCFPRSQTKSKSFFVLIEGEEKPRPHAVGLCGSGTTGHHGAVEAHDAWIKLEDDVWNYYERSDNMHDPENEWTLVGPLNPQPGSREARPKRKRLKGDDRRKRKTISLRVPDDTEDGGELWDEILERVKAKLVKEGLYSEGDNIPVYEALMAALNDWLS